MRAILAAVTLALAACGSDDGGATETTAPGDVQPDGSGDVQPDGSGDATTADGDGQTSFCGAANPCTGAGEVCDCHGQCVVATGNACTEDRNCGVPRWCNTCTGHCEAQVDVCQPCEESRACLDQGACLPYASGGTYCGLACVGNAGCPDGFGCISVSGVDQKQCVAESRSCDDLGLCQGDSECPVGEICSDATRRCAPGCAEDGQCQGDNVCVAARCVPPCTGDGDCDAPATCEAGGHCKVPGACEVRSDCPEPVTYCSRETGRCEPGCQVDLDCGDAGMVCEGGGCVAKGCLHNFECAFAEVCDKPSGACVPFPAGEQHCAVCDAEAETNPSCADPSLCVGFKDEQDQERGDFCIVQCKDDPVDRCPQGWQCRQIDPENEPDGAFFCIRTCYIDPLAAQP